MSTIKLDVGAARELLERLVGAHSPLLFDEQQVLRAIASSIAPPNYDTAGLEPDTEHMVVPCYKCGRVHDCPSVVSGDVTDARLAATPEQMVKVYIRQLDETLTALRDSQAEVARLRAELDARDAELKELMTETDQLWRQAKGRWAVDGPRIERIQQEWRFGQTIRTDDMDWIVEQFRSAPLVVPSRAAASLTEEREP